MTDKEEHTWKNTLGKSPSRATCAGPTPRRSSKAWCLTAPPTWRRSTTSGDGSTARAGEADLDKAWKEEWEREADRVAAYGDKADAEGFKITAGNQYMRAGNYYYSAERFIPPGEEKWAMYRKALRCYQGAMARLHPDIERVEVPYEKGLTLPAYFVKGRGDGRRPTVVLFDGMDNAKEMSVIFAGLDLAKRGFNVLAIDGPGQSEPLRLRNIPSRYDYEAAGIPAYDFVAARPDVDPKRVAVMGYSFGGYHAPRICAFEKRYAAGVAFGAMHWSVYDFVTSHGVADPTRASSSTFQWRWVVGAKDNAEGAGDRQEIHARRGRSESGVPVPGRARRRMTASCRSTRRTSSMRRSVPRKRICASSPPRKAARNIARSITASTASTSSETG